MRNLKKKFILSFLFIFCALLVLAQTAPKIFYFNLQDVRLLESPFKHAEDLNLNYLLALDADRLLAPFFREAGLEAKAESYTNWENSGLDGHIGGHYLSGLSYMYASTENPEIYARLNYMINQLKLCQDANGDGYIGGVPGSKAVWAEIKEGKINASGFGLNGKWVPLYNIHKTFSGLRDAYLLTRNEIAKEMLIKYGDWAINIFSKLSDEQMQDMLRSEHGGLNEVFADIFAISGDEKYLTLARRFSHRFILAPLINKEDKLTGLHANTQIPKVIGYKRISELDGNKTWSDAALFFWENVTQKRTVSIGGNSASEHFHPVDDYSRMLTSVEGPETCNTYNMLHLTKMLHQTSPEARFLDFYERGLYNHILSTQNPETGGLVYFTPMRAGHYRVYSQSQTSFWCCVGSGIENHSKYGEMIYAHSSNDLYVNLFIPSKVNWKEKNVTIIQENNFPEEAQTQFTIQSKRKTQFTLKIRFPKWVSNQRPEVMLNGKPILVPVIDGFIVINRKWKKNDKLTLKLPMQVTVEQIPDKSNYYSFLYGPIVLASKTGTENMDGLFADDSRGGHIAHGRQVSQRDLPIIVGDKNLIASYVQPVQGKKLTFMLLNLAPEKFATGMELIPFNTLHESRYMLYFPFVTPEEAEKISKKIEADERERMHLESKTVDKVILGEQQPESDHAVKYENSQTGFVEDVQWREARGWFSYEMRNRGKQAKLLYIEYFDRDRSRNFDVFINDIRVGALSLTGTKGDKRQTKIFPIPEKMISNEILSVKFVPMPGSTTAKITEVRLLNTLIE
ncbi:MAG: Non-reducing end beta-L-arabinofuranosidase [Bacteroidetes bacterium ADurb.Bin174]|nr:MAG: Non-reducing end beta-L-arabinofuranosidase [Bacteroidetes bacterium ADurb.Bin174]